MAKKYLNRKVCPNYAEVSIDQEAFFYKKKFYSGAENFTYFKDMKQKSANNFKKKIDILFPIEDFPYGSFKRYKAVLKYLIASKSQKDFKSFDEKIVFLIQAIDPDLSIYFFYLGVGYSPYANSEEKNQKEKALITYITSIIGVLDAQFLKYEELYLLRFLKYKNIVSFVNSDYSSRFFNFFKLIPSFDDVNDNEFRFVSRKAEYFKANCKDPNNINTICYNLKNPNNDLEIYYISHQVMFFILTADPDLNALKIYEEESTVDNIKNRMLEELGFYHEDFIKIEKLFCKRFFPGRKTSAWNL